MVADVQVASAVLSERAVERQKRWVLAIVNLSHTINHMNSSMMSILFAVMMGPLGFGYAELGVLQTVNTLVSNGLQATYGVIAQYVKRSIILGAGNTLLGLASIATSTVTGFPQLVFWRAMAGAGSSPQHPVGSTILSTYFGASRGRALGLHNTAGNVGTLIAPLLAAVMLAVFDWRIVVIIIGIPSVFIGLSYFWLRDVVRPSDSHRARGRAGWGAYVACLKNRDLMLVSALMMVGAAGRGGGINQTYLVPHFIHDLGIESAIAASLLTIVNAGGLVGPLAWGWISDRIPRKLAMQASLILTAIATVWLGIEGSLGALLLLNLAIYGLVVQARGAITQAMVGDYAGEELED